MRLRSSAFSTAAAALLLVAASPALASKTCSDAAVSARGEPAQFMWLAKTKARANWRRKVRATPTLGTDFANWSNAETSEERCITAEGGTVCVFTGYPCKH
jgi:hypothetical protein